MIKSIPHQILCARTSASRRWDLARDCGWRTAYLEVSRRLRQRYHDSGGQNGGELFGMFPCCTIVRWAHRQDERSVAASVLRSSVRSRRFGISLCLENPCLKGGALIRGERRLYNRLNPHKDNRSRFRFDAGQVGGWRGWSSRHQR